MGDGGEFFTCYNPPKFNDRIIYPKRTAISYSKHKSPKCCQQIYNMMVDRNKLKKLRSFNLSRPVRTVVYDLKLDPIPICKSREFKTEEEEGEGEEGAKEEVKPDNNNNNNVIIHEFQDISDSISFDDNEKYLIHVCESGSVTECSGCSTLGGAIKQKIHVKPKLHWQDLLSETAIQKCHRRVYKIMERYKGNACEELKIKSTII
ncbi:hypothetical protein Phum_PHUM399510 [Pediculus humanus corporis]|uniref:Uncharacterized protein n=1 Tax=Pediculus humanus subsp. corporis TaxID=121224 RepID=E0VRJ9_PEDHC|nr:uncharacterized protein Phum_PHUM399510 [Pediculus humanus corporis]EEB16005.1 hypothetical protein Phum_PHUM399510 [Pediculus humanus corporis]